MQNPNKIIVGMADLNTIKGQGKLITLGLGSCVGIALYDPQVKVAGLAHAMLPNSQEIKNNSNVAKFVDSAMIKLVKDMISIGAKQDRLVAKIAGGAQMFAFNSTQDNMRIGDRNVQFTEHMLRRLNIPLLKKDVGKNFGRTVELNCEDGSFLIKTIGNGTYIL